MQSGELDHLYEVLKRTEEKDSAGQKKWIWTKIGAFYGGEAPVNTTAFSSSGAMGSALVVQINYRPEDFPDLLDEHQLRDVDSQKIYAITGILPVNRAKHRIMCTVGKI
ncbi:phage head completion protein [Acinetobacter indicus]|uniref:phage head completion protein n=1 Tax=Acinetobacter indicus TaxID=756892 RepID=UPI000948A6E6|nr:head-tail adaptor protein [Acinetobacter indicus]